MSKTSYDITRFYHDANLLVIAKINGNTPTFTEVDYGILAKTYPLGTRALYVSQITIFKTSRKRPPLASERDHF